MPKTMFSQNVIVKLITQGAGNMYSGGDVYGHLREMVESGVLENEGVFIVEQETKMGTYGKTYSFDNCEKVVEVWAQLYGKDEMQAETLIDDVITAIDGNIKLKAQFPNWLLRKLLKYRADKKK